MSAQQREDYLLRQIKALAAMLARIIGLRLEGSTEEARAELEQAFGALLGDRSDLIRRLDSSTAAVLLQTPTQIVMYARLLSEEATLGHGSLIRAAELTIEALRRDAQHSEARELLQHLRDKIDLHKLASSYQADFRELS